MKIILAFIVLSAIPAINCEIHCNLGKVGNITTDWITMVSSCTKKLRNQVQIELQASVTYLAMGSYFLQDKVNRPGFAKFFLESASEERQHALKLIEYLLMRGALNSTVEFEKLIDTPKPEATSWTNGTEALKEALKLEISVTKNIRDIIVECEKEEPPNKSNDYHVVDWLTADFLDEQYKGQRDLAGKISTLSKMTRKEKENCGVLDNSVLGEFLYDKTL